MISNRRAGLVPIVVAVTGHRDIAQEDVAQLTSVVSSQLRALSAQHPDSPCLLLSGMAEGADRLVARCALDAGWRLAAVLPLAQAEYERDFRDEQSVAEFRDLLTRAAWVRDLSGGSVSRPDCYRVLGDWLAREAHLLLALWDGSPGNGPGGTADVVRIFREGAAPERLILPDAGPVIHVHTRRPGSTPAVVLGTVQYLPACPGGLPNPGEETRWKTVLQRIDQFNRDLVRASPSKVAEIESPVRSKAELAHGIFLAADAMAMTAQKERDTLFKGLMGVSCVAIVLAQVYSSLFSLPILLAGAIAMSGVGFVWHFVVARQHVEQRYLDYRALAEACKVQYFWKTVGIEACASDHFLREQRDELEWIRQAIQTTELGSEPVDASPLEARLAQVRDAWIDDQLRYFSGDAKRPGGKAAFNRMKDTVWSRRGAMLFASGMLLAVLTTVFHAFLLDPTSDPHAWILRSMTVGYSLIFGAAALTKVYQENRAFSEHAKQYQRMGLTLQIARGRLDTALAAGELSVAVGVVKAVGIEALSENGNWLLLHRDRPVSAQGIG